MIVEDLVRWYRQQLDEEQGIARACAGNGEWTANDIKVYGPDLSVAVRAHMADHDPARVLREIDSKRRQVEWCVEVIGPRDLSRYEEVGSLKDDPDALAVTLAVETLRLLAAVYADRPGYQESWRP